MTGKILHFDVQQGTGIIQVDDETRYPFIGAEVRNMAGTLSQGMEVDFEVDEQGVALEIYVLGGASNAQPNTNPNTFTASSPYATDNSYWMVFKEVFSKEGFKEVFTKEGFKELFDWEGCYTRSQYWRIVLLLIGYSFLLIVAANIIAKIHYPDKYADQEVKIAIAISEMANSFARMVDIFVIFIIGSIPALWVWRLSVTKMRNGEAQPYTQAKNVMQHNDNVQEAISQPVQTMIYPKMIIAPWLIALIYMPFFGFIVHSFYASLDSKHIYMISWEYLPGFLIAYLLAKSVIIAFPYIEKSVENMKFERKVLGSLLLGSKLSAFLVVVPIVTGISLYLEIGILLKIGLMIVLTVAFVFANIQIPINAIGHENAPSSQKYTAFPRWFIVALSFSSIWAITHVLSYYSYYGMTMTDHAVQFLYVLMLLGFGYLILKANSIAKIESAPQ